MLLCIGATGGVASISFSTGQPNRRQGLFSQSTFSRRRAAGDGSRCGLTYVTAADRGRGPGALRSRSSSAPPTPQAPGLIESRHAGLVVDLVRTLSGRLSSSGCWTPPTWSGARSSWSRAASRR